MSSNFKYNGNKGVYEIMDSNGSVLCEKKTAQEARSYTSRKTNRKELGFGVWGVPTFFSMQFGIRGNESHGRKN